MNTHARTVKNFMKRYNICIISILYGEEREKITEEIFEVILFENFLKLMTNKITDPGSLKNSKKKAY